MDEILIMLGMFLRGITESMMDFVVGKGREKIFLYSGHDTNVAGFLHSLKLKFTKLPYFCAAVVVELHLQNGKYFVRVRKFCDHKLNSLIVYIHNQLYSF